MKNAFDLTGKSAIVTGANTGLGQAMAIALATAGANLSLVGRSKPHETVEAIEKLGGRTHVIDADLSDVAVIPSIIDSTVDAFGAVDILVNNAGIIRRNDALDFTEEEWDSVIDVNLKSLFFLSQSTARAMLNSYRPGKIINIASMLSYQGGVRVASYTAAKSGVMGLTRLLANEWAQHGINVNAIAPGYFATNNTQALRNDERRSAEILGRIPAGRWGSPSDLGGAVTFLASSAADYVHGITLPVDGGWLAR